MEKFMNFTMDQLLFAILAGILGTVIWEMLLKKYSPSIIRFFFKLIIFKKEKFKRKIYYEISKGYFENTYRRIIENALVFPLSILVVVVLFSSVSYYKTSNELNYYSRAKDNKIIELTDLMLHDEVYQFEVFDLLKLEGTLAKNRIILDEFKRGSDKLYEIFFDIKENKQRLDSENLSENQKDLITDNINELLKKYNAQRARSISLEEKIYALVKASRFMSIIILIPFLIAAFPYAAFIYSRQYITSAKFHFYRCLNICRPYVEQKEIDFIISRFFLIKCKDDFISVLNSFEETAKKENIELPKFSVW
jgi:hypothetical protein